MNEDALTKLEDLLEKLTTNRLTFTDKMEVVTDFINSDLKYIVKQVENGYERIEELSNELEEAKERINELED